MMEFTNEAMEESAENIIKMADDIISKFGPRTPGSKSEKEATEYVKDKFSPHVDSSSIEIFQVVPKLFMGFITYCIILDLLAIVFYWIVPWISVIFSFGSVLIFLFEFWFYQQFLDPLFPKVQSQNLIATRKSLKTPDKRLILNAHIDTSFEWRWNLKNSYFSRVIILLGIFFIFFALIVTILNAIFNNSWENGIGGGWAILGYIFTGFSPLSIFLLSFWNYRVASPGANDNLSGVLLLLEAAKQLTENNIQLQSTEITFLITGSEEAGTRGALEYVKKNKELLTDIPTTFLVFDTIADPENISILSSDMNNAVKLDTRVVGILDKAAKICQVPAKILPFPPGAGSTDAARFAKAGFPTGSIVAGKVPLPTWYHTRLDCADAMNALCLKQTLEILLQTIIIYDQEGLRDTLL
ncbi:MAG: M20/M25/M40 family metallo-hydrolase [Promethearchaeota archaeon]